MSAILIIGIGNHLRGDDAAGLLVARDLAARQLAGVSVVELGDDLTTLLDHFQASAAVFIADAVRSGRHVGAIRRIDLHAALIPSDFAVSSHSLGLFSVIELARSLGTLPAELVFFGIEGSQFELGSMPSDAVRTAASEASSLIVAEAAQLKAGMAHA